MTEKDTTQVDLIAGELEKSQLAALALDEFDSKNYAACLRNLIELEEKIGTNTKLLHNKAVVEFYCNDFKKYEEFRKALDEILGELAHNVDAFDGNDASVAVPLFNQAVILFQLRQPLAALKIVLTLLKNIDALQLAVAQRVGLLAVNLLLNLNQPKKAEVIIELLQTRENLDKLSSSEEDDDTELLLNKTTDITTTKSLDQFKWMFRLYKLRSKVLNDETVVIPNEETPETLVLKAHQYYSGHDYQMAAKELAKTPVTPIPNVLTNGEDYNTIVANNMGLIHFHVRHYAMAVRFFQHALTFDQTACDNLGLDPPLHALGASKQPEILYNLGIAMLHLQRPKEAFECLLVPLNYYHNNPKLWLRLAEACIMVHKQNLKKQQRKHIVSSTIGSGIHRKYIVHPTPQKHITNECQSFAIPSTNLEFASLCLRNALTLLEHYENDFKRSSSSLSTDAQGKKSWQQINEKTHCNPSKVLTFASFEKLKCATLAAYSYVQINLGEYLLALKYGQELAQVPNLPDAYAMLANLYCAESLIMMDRCNEARAYLEPKFINQLKEDDFIHRSSPDWNISSLGAAQSILEYNLSVVLVLQGETELARAMMNRCKHPIVMTHLKMLKVYMEMQAGNLEACRIMVRMDTPQYY